MKITDLYHPTYLVNYTEWYKYRLTYKGGRDFVEAYTKKFSTRESNADFITRKEVTYCPSHAKAAINDIKNAIFQRMVDISRVDGPDSYQKAISGEDTGVDNAGSSMNSWLGRIILPELLVLGRVGIYIDRPMIQVQTLQATRATRPYLYLYRAEDILSWHFDSLNRLDALLLLDHFYDVDEETLLITGYKTRYRYLKLTEDGVEVKFYLPDKENILLEYETTLKLKRIPFVMPELTSSLLVDVADYQIALLNLASSDMSYALKSNFPFYTEQYEPLTELLNNRQGATEGTASEAADSKNQNINVGAAQGRKYPKGLERPEFIHPSAEPLNASMEKQDRLIIEIRQLVNLALTNVRPVRASAESKQIDNQGLEAGLSYIGLELQTAEQEIAKIWADYENTKPATIRYPDNYELRTDKDRREEASELETLKKGTPSQTYKKTIAKQIAKITVGSKVSPDTLQKIYDEIDAADVVDTDPDTIRNDHESGFVSTATASKLRGYNTNEWRQAQQDHATRLARIAAAQSTASTARGIPDAGDPDDGRKEKEASRITEQEETTADRTRGEGK